MSEVLKNEGLLVVICGPSGAGKGTIYNTVLEHFPKIKKSISVTTRKARAGEKEGVHYYFKTLQEYQQMIAQGEFLETASVFENFYGTPKKEVLELIKNGEDVMFEIDVEGAKQIKDRYSDSILIFIMPPSFKVLEERLRQRGTEAEESIIMRLREADNELKQYDLFDYFVINDQLDDAVKRVESIIISEKLKLKRNKKLILDILGEKDK